VKWWLPAGYLGLHHKNRAFEEWKRSHGGADAIKDWKRRQEEE
jgi:hypothetical protein